MGSQVPLSQQIDYARVQDIVREARLTLGQYQTVRRPVRKGQDFPLVPLEDIAFSRCYQVTFFERTCTTEVNELDIENQMIFYRIFGPSISVGDPGFGAKVGTDSARKSDRILCLC